MVSVLKYTFRTAPKTAVSFIYFVVHNEHRAKSSALSQFPIPSSGYGVPFLITPPSLSPPLYLSGCHGKIPLLGRHALSQERCNAPRIKQQSQNQVQCSLPQNYSVP